MVQDLIILEETAERNNHVFTRSSLWQSSRIRYLGDRGYLPPRWLSARQTRERSS